MATEQEVREQLIRRRIELNLPQSEVARRMGMSQANFSELETGAGHLRPRLVTLVKWADALGFNFKMEPGGTGMEGYSGPAYGFEAEAFGPYNGPLDVVEPLPRRRTEHHPDCEFLKTGTCECTKLYWEDYRDDRLTDMRY